MTVSAHDSLVLLALLVSATALLVLAPILRIPYPILLVLGGLAIGFIPGVPHYTLRPDIVLVGFLPPLLYAGAFFTSLRDLRTNARPIALLSVGLVLATMLVVAAVCHAVIGGLSWPVCFVIGAIVAPTDAVAATAIGSRLGLPRRLVTLIEGESLINDATALVAYSFAVAAVVTGQLLALARDLALRRRRRRAASAIGLAVGYVLRQFRRRINHSPTEIAIALLSGYFAYLPAQAAGVSAVLAVVTVGVYVGWYTPELTTVQTRLQGDAVWEILTFLLNAVLFGLVGLQLRPDPRFAARAAPRRPLHRRRRDRQPGGDRHAHRLDLPGDVHPAGACRSASASAIPTRPGSTRRCSAGPACEEPCRSPRRSRCRSRSTGGDSFPQRSFIIYLAFCVILATLVCQGLTLPAVIRVLRLEDDGISEKEETKARIHAAEAALGRLEELAGEDWVREDTAERMRGALPLPGQSLRRPLRRRRRRGDRGAVAELPATPARAAGRRAQRRRRAAPAGPHQRHRHEPRAARPRPRGRPARRLIGRSRGTGSR